MSKVCYTCVSGKTFDFSVVRDGHKTEMVQLGDTDKKIPKWYKEAGIYSPLAPQITCNPKYNWFLEKKLVPILPNNYHHSVTFNVKDIKNKISMDVDYKDTWLAYWASDKRDFDKTIPIGPIQAYGSFHNSGLSRVDSKGFVTIYYDTPTPYMVEGIIYPPHLHFTFLKRDNTWRLNQTTMDIIPDIDLHLFQKLIRSGNYHLINSLPKKIKENIEGSLRIPYNTSLKNLTTKLKQEISTKHTPIIVYCKNSECDASHQLIKKMLTLGYNNLIYYAGGIDEYFNI